jgi:hypothetical protein
MGHAFEKETCANMGIKNLIVVGATYGQFKF